MKHILLLATLLLSPTLSFAHQPDDEQETCPLQRAQTGISHFNNISFSASDLPGDLLLVTASQELDTSKLSFALAPYGLHVCYLERLYPHGGLQATKLLLPDFDKSHKQFVVLQLPSGDREQFSLPRMPC